MNAERASDVLASLRPGDAMDRYVVEALLGRGGMGSVYRALDTRLRRPVALKVLSVAGDEAVALALREARAAAAVRHPGVAAVFDAGEMGGLAYIVMELVPGASLRAFVGDPAVDVPTRVRWLCDVAHALGAAHEQNLVHRDVKPENVIVREDGAVKVLDFGVARLRRGERDPDYFTLGGGEALIGTPAYMAPEYARSHDIDARADQFSWGVLAYELLRGTLPWQRGGTLGALAAILADDPEPIPAAAGLPAPLVSVVMRALSKSPADRFPTMADAADALEPYAKPPSRERLLSSPDSGQRTSPPAPPSSPAAAAPTPVRPPSPPSPITMVVPTIPSPAPAGASSSPDPRADPSLSPRPPDGFRAPDFSCPVDLDAHLAAVPPGATVKGMVLRTLLAEGSRSAPASEVFGAAGVRERRYLPFSDYPVADAARLLFTVARLAHPGVPHGEGLRRLGASAFDGVADSQMGKIVFGVFDFDAEQLLLRAARAYAIVHNHGEFAAEKVGPSRYLFHVRGFPSFLETAQVGVLEGLVRFARRRAAIRLRLDAIDQATFEIDVG